MKNKVIIAAAGSGKTTFLIEEALKNPREKILITTYTQANELEIRKKIMLKNGCIPRNVTIQPWFSFLLQHGVKPYQGCLIDKKVNGLFLSKGNSVPFIPETNFKKHYFTDDLKIFSDKIGKFVLRCNEKTGGRIFDRLSRIYTQIFIDEIQDLAGYDLEILKHLFSSSISILVVGDPRQGTYSTNNSAKNKQFRTSNIVNFFKENKEMLTLDDSSLLVNYRSNQEICSLANKLYPEYLETKSGNLNRTGHDGIFAVREKDVEYYLEKYNPVQLRDSAKTKTNVKYETFNFGVSKGLTFDRVIIYPTMPIVKWLNNHSALLAPSSCSKFYVALTRAKYSVAIVCSKNIHGLSWYEHEDT